MTRLSNLSYNKHFLKKTILQITKMLIKSVWQSCLCLTTRFNNNENHVEITRLTCLLKQTIHFKHFDGRSMVTTTIKLTMVMPSSCSLILIKVTSLIILPFHPSTHPLLCIILFSYPIDQGLSLTNRSTNSPSNVPFFMS